MGRRGRPPKLSKLPPDSIADLKKLIKLIEMPGSRKVSKKLKKREPRIGFNLQIPDTLYHQLGMYIRYYADPGETKTSIILVGLEKELRERYMKKIAPANGRITKRRTTKFLIKIPAVVT